MSGIVFFRTERHDAIVEFYTEEIGCDIWLEQPDCTILKYDNQLLGFCDRDRTDTEGIITFVEPNRAGVDDAYERLQAYAREPPAENEQYEIYQFFADDPDGRTVEIQAFCHPTDPI